MPSGLRKSNFHLCCFPQENTEDIHALVTVQAGNEDTRGVHIHLYSDYLNYGMVKEFSLEQAMKAQRGSSGIALLFL
jgi:hypothetical protein